MSSMKTSYIGPPIDDPKLLFRLPEDIAQEFQICNGFIALSAGLHVRGACLAPAWHSIRAAWEGEAALHRLFPAVKDSDVPLAEDCFGDQFLLRDGSVLRVFGETGELEETQLTWTEFLAAVEANPVDFLRLQPFQRFQQEGGVLEPGLLLSVYPPFVAKECVNPSLRPIPALDRRSSLADFARQIGSIRDGQKVKITVLE
jgi:hypothetical protein